MSIRNTFDDKFTGLCGIVDGKDWGEDGWVLACDIEWKGYSLLEMHIPLGHNYSRDDLEEAIRILQVDVHNVLIDVRRYYPKQNPSANMSTLALAGLAGFILAKNK